MSSSAITAFQDRKFVVYSLNILLPFAINGKSTGLLSAFFSSAMPLCVSVMTGCLTFIVHLQ